MFSTAMSDFALWVRVAWHDIPNEMEITTKAEGRSTLGIRFAYRNGVKTWTRRATKDVQMYCAQETNYIAGFDIPLRSFNKHVADLIVWLRNTQKDINNECLRNNYRLIASLLQMKANELLMPPQ